MFIHGNQGFMDVTKYQAKDQTVSKKGKRRSKGERMEELKATPTEDLSAWQKFELEREALLPLLKVKISDMGKRLSEHQGLERTAYQLRLDTLIDITEDLETAFFPGKPPHGTAYGREQDYTDRNSSKPFLNGHFQHSSNMDKAKWVMKLMARCGIATKARKLLNEENSKDVRNAWNGEPITKRDPALVERIRAFTAAPKKG